MAPQFEICNPQIWILNSSHFQFEFPPPPGKKIEKVVPLPTSDSTMIRPWWRSTMSLQIARPRPVPFCSPRLCRALGGKERLEDSRHQLRRDAWPGISHLQVYFAGASCDLENNR